MNTLETFDIYSNKIENPSYEQRFILDNLLSFVHLHLITNKTNNNDDDDVNDDVNDDDYIKNTKNYNVVYSDDTCKMVINKNTKFPFNMFAVKDYRFPNKYLILYGLGESTHNVLYGFFVFFDTNGYQNKLINIPNQLFQWDFRDVHPSEKNIFLYDGNLMFIYKQRDFQSFTINYIKFNKSYSHIELACNMSNDNWGQIIPTGNHQYIVIKLGTNNFKTSLKYALFDLTFFVKTDEKKNNEYLTGMCHFTNDYSEFTNIQKIHDEFTTFENYPIKCINCNKTTATGHAALNISSCSYTTSYFGHSFCQTCMIRYSITSGKWICCNLKKSIHIVDRFAICENHVMPENNYKCACSDLHVEIPISFDRAKTYVPPYLDTVHITFSDSRK